MAFCAGDTVSDSVFIVSASTIFNRLSCVCVRRMIVLSRLAVDPCIHVTQNQYAHVVKLRDIWTFFFNALYEKARKP